MQMKSAPDFHNGTLRGDIAERSSLIKRISDKLRAYNDFIIQQAALGGFSKAPEEDKVYLENWHSNHDQLAIEPDEQAYLKRADLVSIRFTSNTPLRKALHKTLRLGISAIMRDKNVETPTYDIEAVSHISDKRMDASVSAMILAIGVVMLLTPIWILQAMTDLKEKLGIITAFIFIFLLVLSLVMVAKPFEALGATAAYAAVLMVFTQLSS
ncbi:hypothetical protein CGCTS75_v006359 [Colletotrichum tropicale]|nr:hypothetical protein CGCTS75_v006359 [Colletotrichum tropicale]